MWDALAAGFAESRSWFDSGNPIGPMLRIQGDAQLLKTLLLESLREPPRHIFNTASLKSRPLLRMTCIFSSALVLLQPILNRNSCDGFCLPLFAR